MRDEVRARADLAEVVGQYVPLRRAGKSLKACCPFHQEKTPSFHVSPDRGMFYCFGCKASGDVFSFYERIEGVSFPEALRALAQRYGVEIEEEVRDPARLAEERRARELTDRLREASELAAEFFHARLAGKDGLVARDELEHRGVDAETAARFRLGYAPATWDALAEHFREHKISPADAEIAGLLMAGKRSGFYDRFRHRLMFPICDREGHVVGFSGRILAVQPGMPEGMVPEDAGKYINSPETPIYRKSDSLFGLAVARTSMRQTAEAILVEGNFDVVSMHQHGFANTVAPLGTAFTESQAKLLRRFAERVFIVFDADEAGRKATRVAQGACARAGLLARVVSLPGGKDPDEVLRSAGGRDRLATALHRAPAIVDWLIDDIASRCGDTTPERIAALREIAPIIANVTDPIERDVYVDNAARKLVFQAGQVQRAVRDAERETKRGAEDPFLRRPELVRNDGVDHFRRPTASTVTSAPVRSTSERKRDPVSEATTRAMDALLRAPALLSGDLADELLGLTENEFARNLLTEAQRQWRSRGELDGPALLATAPSDKARAWIGERIMPRDEPTAAETSVETSVEHERALGESLTRLRTLRDQEQARRLKIEHARARSEGDDERAIELLRKATLIEQRIAANQNRGTE